MSQSLNQKLSERISARDYGAVGDGLTDDTAAIQAALTAINTAGGGELFLPPGTYLWSSPLYIYSNTTFSGAGASSILKVKNSAGAWNFMITQGHSPMVNVAIRDIRFDQNTTGNATGIPTVSPAKAKMAIYFTNFGNVEISGCTFDDLTGIWAIDLIGTNSYDARVFNNRFRFVATADTDYDNTAIYFDCADFVAYGNYFKDASTSNWARAAIEAHKGPGEVVANFSSAYQTVARAVSSEATLDDPESNNISIVENTAYDALRGIDIWPIGPGVAGGKFANASDAAYWTLGTGWSIGGGVATKAAGNTETLSQVITDVTVGRSYSVTYTLTKTAGDGITVSIGGKSGTKRTVSGIYTELLAATTTGGLFFTPAPTGGGDFAGTIDNVIVFDAQKALRNVLICGNTIHVNNHDRISAHPTETVCQGIGIAFSCLGTIDGVTISDNLIRFQAAQGDPELSIHAGGIVLRHYGALTNALVKGNLIVDCPVRGMSLEGLGAGGYSAVQVLDNLFVDSGNDSLQPSALRTGLSTSGVLKSVRIARNRIQDTGTPTINGYYSWSVYADSGSSVVFTEDNKVGGPVANLTAAVVDAVSDAGWNVLAIAGGNVAVDASLAEVHYLEPATATAFAFSNPSGIYVPGRKLTIIVKRTAGAISVGTWGASYKWRSGTALPNPTADGRGYGISFICKSATEWLEVFRTETEVVM